jgi:alkylated DNA repair dioxygenase AlkB
VPGGSQSLDLFGGDTLPEGFRYQPDFLTQEEEALTEYTAGAAIGWHKDRLVFGDIIGISLLSPCNFRFRKKAGAGWERRNLMADRRSAYLLRGPSRLDWEHSIPGVGSLRYSITVRNVLQRTS